MSNCKFLTRSFLLAGAAFLTASGAFGQAAQPAPAPTPANIRANVTQTAVDSRLDDDAAVEKMLTAYAPKVRALDQTIAQLKGDLRKGGAGAGSLGNFVTDGMRSQASSKLGRPVVLAVTNSGGLRKNAITEGNLSYRDIFELLPFENALVAFDLTGAQVLDLLRVMMLHRDAQSGARIVYKVNAAKQLELESAKFLVNGVEQEIDPAKTYTIICIDYLLNVTGGDYAAILKQASLIKPLDLTTRDAITNYVKAETAAGRPINSTLDRRFVFDKAASGQAEEPK